MKNNNTKLIMENWRKFINEEDDLTGGISDVGLEYFDNEMETEMPDAVSVDERDQDIVDEHEEEIERFCRIVGVDRSGLEDFLRDQAFQGDLEGVSYDEEGDELDPGDYDH